MTPRDKFRSNRALTRGYNDAIHGDQLQAALNAATREYDLKLPIALDVTAAAANRWRKEGADAFRKILEELNSDSAPATPKSTSELQHA